ncbi:MAG: LptA/OstA family protein [Paracoccaceae bacterium]|jgi:lipopolysaccharide export system protein LptA
MIKAFLLILIILPSYLLSDNTDGGFGSIANDRNEPISFSSNTLSFNQETGTSEMKGSVSIIQGNTVLSSDYAEVSFNVDTNELERFYASGNVVLKSGNDIASGNEAIYNFIEGQLTFLGEVHFSQSGSTVKADKAVINTETGSASMTGNVQTTLLPTKQEGSGE